MKLVIRVIVNIFLFALYSLIGMNAVNFIYDLILSLSGNPVPVSNDPVHLKIAGIIFVLVSLFTIIFRKYFYLKIIKKEVLEENNELDIDNNVSFEKISTKIDKERESIPYPLHSEVLPLKKEEIKKKKKIKKNVKVLKEGDMEIFMGKEIK